MERDLLEDHCSNAQTVAVGANTTDPDATSGRGTSGHARVYRLHRVRQWIGVKPVINAVPIARLHQLHA